MGYLELLEPERVFLVYNRWSGICTAPIRTATEAKKVAEAWGLDDVWMFYGQQVKPEALNAREQVKNEASL